ncbi:hypothetical protein [Streptomyces xanthophaeus]|uniref:hypothetical protein n=1 Tax=Streptomyces xanthophaeus TaxID=67385 RepID=UPI00264773B7|nr:hypothetical protein [Streptomyces xanthophaeus]WKD36349.1 hypothetical protein KO717_33360 [Streptomyces xanthophaeus]
MQLRLALPLTLAALVTATGCVTVRPAAPPDAQRQAHGAAARTQDRQPTPLALPLSPLPASPEPASPVPPPPPAPPGPPSPRMVPEAGPAPVPVQAAAERPRRPRRADAKPPRPRRPAERAKPAAPAKPRKRPPTVADKPRPEPQGSYDMASLCEAAKGTVHPSIVALCH